MRRRFCTLLLTLVWLVLPATAAHALARTPVHIPAATSGGVYLNPTTGRFWTAHSYEGSTSDPLSLHKYLYCHANPVNNTDPTGMFTQQLGYAAEEAIGQIYAMDHPGDAVAYGTWTRLGGAGNPAFRLKPDIFNTTTKRWAEVKPFSYSGIVKGAAQYAT